MPSVRRLFVCVCRILSESTRVGRCFPRLIGLAGGTASQSWKAPGHRDRLENTRLRFQESRDCLVVGSSPNILLILIGTRPNRPHPGRFWSRVAEGRLAPPHRAPWPRPLGPARSGSHRLHPDRLTLTCCRWFSTYISLEGRWTPVFAGDKRPRRLGPSVRWCRGGRAPFHVPRSDLGRGRTLNGPDLI